MMGLPYPGGPEISKLAAKDREDVEPNTIVLPRPMLDKPNLDFSFSGLKTAVLYTIKGTSKNLSEDSEPLQSIERFQKKIQETLTAQGAELDTREKEKLARAFEDAVTDVLISKTSKALKETSAQTLAIGGGVSANPHLQRSFKNLIEKEFPYVTLCLPPNGLTGDNAIMIGIAGFYRALNKQFVEPGAITANGNLSLSIDSSS